VESCDKERRPSAHGYLHACHRAKKLTVHHLLDDLPVVDHHVGLLTVHPALSVLVPVSEDGDLVIEHGKLNVTISLFLDSVEGTDLVFTGIPIQTAGSSQSAIVCN
jgi:hypothetical protein